MQIVKNQDEPTDFFIENPKIEVLRDCIFAPIKGNEQHGHNFWTNRHWGVYDSNGDLVDGAKFSYLPNYEISGQNKNCLFDLKDVPYAPASQYFYVGNLINHYGHFLCSSLSRIWALPEINLKRIPLLGHSEGDARHWFSWPFLRPILNAAGVVQEDFADFHSPVRLRELVVAHPSMVERNLIHRSYALTMNEIGDRLTKGSNLPQNIDTVYISKTKNVSHTPGLTNENELVSHIEAAGIPIIYPEQLSLSDQINIFRSTRCVMGQCGSAMHTSSFARPRSGQIMISLIDKPQSYSSNHGMIDRANGSNTTFVYSPMERYEIGGPYAAHRLINPEETARDLISLARSL